MAYTIKYRNDGLATAQDMVVAFLPPEHAKFVSVDPGTVYDPVLHVVKHYLAEVAPGASGEFTLRMTVDPGLPDGMLLGADLGVLSKAQAYETFKHHTKPLSDGNLISSISSGQPWRARCYLQYPQPLQSLPNNVLEAILAKLRLKVNGWNGLPQSDVQKCYWNKLYNDFQSIYYSWTPPYRWPSMPRIRIFDVPMRPRLSCFNCGKKRAYGVYW